MWTYLLPFALVCFCECLFRLSTADQASDWTDVVMAQAGSAVTLPCLGSTPAQWDSWMMMSAGESHWTVLLSADASGGPVHGLPRKLIQLGGRMFEITEDASLRFIVTATAGGRYSCSMRVNSRTLEKRIVLLALIDLTITPPPPIKLDGLVRLEAKVFPAYVATRGAWHSPTGARLLTSISSAGIFLTKLPHVAADDQGLYTCSIRVRGQSHKPVYNYTLAVAVDVRHVAPLPSIKYDSIRSAAVLAGSPVELPCPPVLGDYVRLYWWRPDTLQDAQPELAFSFDRWRNRTHQAKPRLQLQGPASPGSTGNISFLLTPALADAGHYQCEVFLDSEAFGQVTALTVLRGHERLSSSSLDLRCEFAERSQVASVGWTHVPALNLMQTAIIGRVTITVPLPVTPDTAGPYTCTLRLKTGQVVSYQYTLAPPPTEGNSMPEPPILLPSLSLLLFLVPVSAVAVGLLLWRWGRCTFRRNVECTLSHYSGEVENIYEDPEDLRQSTPQSAVYMDLKPTGQTDVYRELDRYDKCCA
ncbi:g6f-like isoform X2 [Electrophorus electricus]|uniref:g6f-like isoform X2 n=1 Tax=Electrophorus electricus TaxID=8005 RepID=UPI0015D0862F|nr:g6f-like isoform X2 [Electrophorus electricus]